MKLSVVHRLRHGHWYESRFVPVSDYVEWRVCGVCSDERARESHARTLALQAQARAEGRSLSAYTQICRSPYPISSSRAREPEAESPDKGTGR